MWKVKYLDKKTKKVKTIKNSFETKEDADNYINNNMKDTEDVWTENKEELDVVDLNEKIGCWLYIFSPKKKEFFSYGKIIATTSQFAKLQTKEILSNEYDYVDMRISRIKDDILNKKMQILKEGSFVNLKEYL